MNAEFSAHAKISVAAIGRERSAVVAIDDAALYPESLVERACALAYAPEGAYYPGVRADAGDEYRQSLSRAALPLIRQVYGIAAPRWRIECFFSIVTARPEQLAFIQRLPHYDGVEADRFAVVHYLCAPGHGGTAFFRHRDTGFEVVTADRFEQYRARLSAGVSREGAGAQGYVSDGAPLFERIAAYDCAYNRLLLYRGASLHCSVHGPEANFSADPRSGRLTVTAFLTPARP